MVLYYARSEPCDGSNLYNTCTVQNLNSGYIIEDAPDVVRVVLAGPRDTIMSMKSDNLRAYIDASGDNQVKIM